MLTPGTLFAVTLLAGIACFTGISAIAAKQDTNLPDNPPSEYRLDDVRIQLTRHPGMRKAPIQQIELSGTGHATLKRDSTSLSFHYESRKLLALLNELYAIRFFELPASYFVKRSIFLKEDGFIGTQIRRMIDAPNTRICLTVSTYEKCVSYDADGPHELRSIEQRVFDEAEHLSKPGVPGQ